MFGKPGGHIENTFTNVCRLTLSFGQITIFGNNLCKFGGLDPNVKQFGGSTYNILGSRARGAPGSQNAARQTFEKHSKVLSRGKAQPVKHKQTHQA